MTAEGIIKEYHLAGGVTAVIRDASRHYFGGYYHVRLQVTAEVPLCADWFETPLEYDNALGCLGRSVRFSRVLEKMAVPQAEIAAVRTALLDSFEANLLSYLSRPDFPRCFVRGEYAKARKPVASNRYARA
jgi:hypothetical protein